MSLRSGTFGSTEPVPDHVLRESLRARETALRISLIFYHRDGAEAALLAPGSPLIVGRSRPADVCIADPTLSREHTRFALVNGRVFAEDLGSTNGTRIGGERVRSAEIRVGDELMLGSVLVCVHALGPFEDRLEVGGEERFRWWIEEEVARAKRAQSRFAVLMVRAGKPLGAHVSRFSPRVRSRLRAVDKMGLYSSDTVQILLPDTDHEAALELCRSITARTIDADAALLVGVALFPGAATTAEQLIELSRAAARRASMEQPVEVAPMATWVADRSTNPDGPLFAGPLMRDLLETVSQVATSRIPVILHGETGTGKEVLARLIHEGGQRRSKPMVCVNCGAIPRDLVESTLFGHERGAFTGAVQKRLGVFEEADGGTVFLDEIAELPSTAQAALLRVLDGKRFTRVGSAREIEVDVRLLAATHRDLERMRDTGQFRADLYYRLSTMTLTIPPLRDRKNEIEPLATLFLRQANRANDRCVDGIEPAALELLQAYSWPGNVRELKNAIERAVVIARSSLLRKQDLPERVRGASGSWSAVPTQAAPVGRSEAQPAAAGKENDFQDGLHSASPNASPTGSSEIDPRAGPRLVEITEPGIDQEERPSSSPSEPSSSEPDSFAPSSGGGPPSDPATPPSPTDASEFRAKIQRYEAQLIIDALDASQWNQTEAARKLGMPLRTLVHKLKALQIKKPVR